MNPSSAFEDVANPQLSQNGLFAHVLFTTESVLNFSFQMHKCPYISQCFILRSVRNLLFKITLISIE